MKKKNNSCPTFSVSRLRVAVCRISAHSCPSHTSVAFALFSFFRSQSTTKFPLNTVQKRRTFFTLVKPNRVKPCLRQGASSGALRGRLRRGPLTSRGNRGRSEAATGSPKPPVHWSSPVYWHMTQPVYSVLARATMAQPERFELQIVPGNHIQDEVEN